MGPSRCGGELGLGGKEGRVLWWLRGICWIREVSRHNPGGAGSGRSSRGVGMRCNVDDLHRSKVVVS